MAFTIKIADCNDPVMDLSLRKLIAAAYHTDSLIQERQLATQIDSHATKPGFFLVAEENNEIIGCAGFLANDFSLNDIAYVGYQCCWAATDPGNRGRKIFTSIVNEAKKILKEQGAGFLYAISNNRTALIFTKKLGFMAQSSVVLRIPRMYFLRKTYFEKLSVQAKRNACIINEEQVKEHKEAQLPSVIKLIRVNGSWIWGRLEKKIKFGVTIPVFYVGGIHLAAEKDLEALVSEIFKSHKAFFVQFFCCATNTFNGLLKGWKTSGTIEFVYYNINMPEFEHLNLMIGALDVF